MPLTSFELIPTPIHLASPPSEVLISMFWLQRTKIWQIEGGEKRGSDRECSGSFQKY
jgi:hypothetical protein